ncbi:hypothetical protein [Mycobacterium sp. AT1]|uniref:hypothetical protein n=1 Tax=Mycobacterium sp. AT1 TaxID=1961706 RepID=UPI0009AF0552|nr:hypothetical protein [Mycobacterium sp. AT1]OPX06109.1 hypothetical protein B1790_29195 [Mycobacterium sp. AT1]
MTARNGGDVVPAFVDLATMLASVSDRAVLADRGLAALVVEFACWEIQLAEWNGRWKPKSHDGRGDWIREGRAMFDDRDTLKARAYALLRRD